MTAPLTVADLAESKRLPVDFLRSLGLRDAPEGVAIPYYAEDGAEIATKLRRKLSLGDRDDGPPCVWPKGVPLSAYGLNQLDRAARAGYVVLCEGETDTATLLYHNFPAIGLPGSGTASTLQREHVAQVGTVYVWREPDAGGEAFVRGVHTRLMEFGFIGNVYAVSSPAAKDPSALHVEDPEQFRARMLAVMDNAHPLATAEAAAAADPLAEPSATAADIIRLGGTIRWAWKNWIPLNLLTAFAAEPGCGKTRLAADLARRIFHGLPWPDGSPATFPAATPCLWVASDHQHPQLASLTEEFGWPPEALVLNAPKSNPFVGTMLDDEPDLDALERRIHTVRPALVFIDTTLNATDLSCTTTEDAKRFFVPLMQIAQRAPECGFVCVTHLNASGKALGLRIRGQCRVVMHLSWPDRDQMHRRKLWVDKSLALYPEPLGVTMGGDGNTYDTDPPRDNGAGPVRDKASERLRRFKETALAVLKRHGAAMQYKQIKAAWPPDFYPRDEELHAALNEARSENLIKCEMGDGRGSPLLYSIC
jgi:hypothetical protein